MEGLIVCLAVVAILFFIFFFVASKAHYKNKYNVKYTPRNMFPYELNYDAKVTDNWMGNILYLFFSIAMVGVFICLFRTTDSAILLTLCIVGVIVNVMGLFIPFVPVKYARAHLLIDILYFILTFFTLACVALTAFEDYQNFDGVFSLVMTIVAAVFTILYFAVIMNPKLSGWAKMDKNENSDGTVYYSRPKYFPLAYTEWLTILTNIITMVLAAILYFAIA